LLSAEAGIYKIPSMAICLFCSATESVSQLNPDQAGSCFAIS